MPPPSTLFSAPRANRRSSPRTGPAPPRTRWACSVSLLCTSVCPPWPVTTGAAGRREVGVEHAGVEAGVLLRGERVGLAPDGLDLAGDLQRCPPPGALEQQVFQEVRGTRQDRGLVARADRDPHAERHAAHGGDRLGDDAQPVGQHGTAYRAAQRVTGQNPGSHGSVVTVAAAARFATIARLSPVVAVARRPVVARAVVPWPVVARPVVAEPAP